MNLPSTKHWLFKAIALAIVVPIPVGLMAFSAVYVSGMQKRGDVPSIVAVLAIYVVPPLWLIALVILGRAEMDIGVGEEPKGELESLLEKKHLGVLRDQPRQVRSWPEHPVKPAAPVPKPARVDSGPVLDQLLDWQRRQHPKPHRDPDDTD
jgi:hypothetical protein